MTRPAPHGDAQLSKRRPCKACPWRVSAAPADIPNFQPDLSARLAVNCRDDGISVMACHKSKEGQRVLCAGYALSVGIKAIGVRMLVSVGAVDLDDYHADEPLHPDFEAMHRAQGVVTPPRNRVEGP